jgi:GTP-binding protein Era
MPEGPWLIRPIQSADLPVRLLAAEITREKLFLRVHEDCLSGGGGDHAVRGAQDGGARIEQTIYVQREGHRPIILGQGRARR